MPNRPYFSYSGEQIRQLFADNLNNPEGLKAVLEELKQRTTPKMKALRTKVEDKLAEFKGGSDKAKSQSSAKEETPKSSPPSTSPVQKDLFDDTPTTPPKSGKTPETDVGSKTKPKSDSPGAKATKEEPLRERRMGKMRKAGKIDGVPAKRQFELKTDFKLELKKDAAIVERYEACLKALVAEMKRQKTAYKQVVLEDGIRLQLDGRENGYQFPYSEDTELFEGAAVTAIIGGVQS